MGTIRAKAINNVVSKSILREVQDETLSTIANVLQNSYGPDGSTTEMRSVVDKKDSGRTDYTKDGHKILGAVKFNKPIEMSIVDDLRNVTRNTVKTVGDGTTSSVILSYKLFHKLNNYCKEYNVSEKEILKKVENVAERIYEIVDKDGRKATLEDIYNIAYTSTDGDEEIAQNIKKIYEDYGNSVYIDVGISNTTDNILKSYDGFTFDVGYFNANFINNAKDSTCVIRDPKIYIFEDPIDTPEMMALLGTIVTENIIMPLATRNEAMRDGKKDALSMPGEVPTVILAPKYSEDVRSELDQVLQTIGNYPPEQRPKLLMVTNITRLDYLYDLAKLSGAKTIKKYIDPNIQKIDIEKGIAATPKNVHSFAGSAEQVISDAKMTKIINPAMMYNKDGSKSSMYENLVKSLKSELQKYEETKKDVTEIYKLKRRIQTLECNMVDYLIGGISYTDRDAKKDLVEDAVLNCRSAAEYGVGCGANFEALKACCQLMVEIMGKEHAINYDQYPYAEDLTKDAIRLILDAYKSLFQLIYNKDNTVSESRLNEIVNDSLKYNCPLNLRTGEYDRKVLSSIQSDIVILKAIITIIGLMFKTNQYLLPDPAFNTYDFDN